MRKSKLVASLLIGVCAIAHAGTQITAPGDIKNFNVAAVAATTGTFLPIHGTADAATKLITARTIQDSGDVTGTGTFDGSSNLNRTMTLATVGAGGTCGDATHVGVITFNVKGLTTACTATSISGVPATTANTLANPRLIGTLTGEVTSAGSNFDGSAANSNVTVLAGTQPTAHTWTASQTFTAQNPIIVNNSANGFGANVALNSDTTHFNQLQLQTGGVNRWLVGTQTAETGSGNTGKDYIIDARDDTGADLGNALLLTRATKNATFGGTVTASAGFTGGPIAGTTGSFSSTLGVAGQLNVTSTTIAFGSNAGTGAFLNINANSGVSKIITIQSAGSNRYQVFSDSSAESGSNAGSNLAIRGYADDGTTTLWQVNATRSTGAWSFPAAVSIAGTTSFSGNTTFGSGDAIQINGTLTMVGTGGATFQNTGANFKIGGTSSANRFVNFDQWGSPTYRYDNNGTGPTLGTLNNLAITGVGQGAAVGTINVGVGGTAGIVSAGSISILSTADWTTTPNSSAQAVIKLANAGSLNNAWRLDPQNGEYVNEKLVHGTADLNIGVTTMSATSSQTASISGLTQVMLFTGTLTANVTYTLPACVNGEHLRITRTGAGAFTWTIAPTTKTLGVNTWGDFECSANVFIETASGSL